MNNLINRLKWWGIILVVLILVIGGCSNASGSLQIAKPAPAFELKDLSGNTVSLGAFEGRTVLINVWATTCPPCVAEMPYFEALQQDWNKRNDVKILMIDLGEPAAKVRDYIKKQNYTFTVLLDTSNEFGEKYNIRYTPSTIIIDRGGIMRAFVAGPFKDKNSVLQAVGPYLNQPQTK
jgi:thiol-disulfide isomerase/thioredoxin